MRIAIYGFKFTRQSLEYLIQVVNECKKRTWEVVFEEETLRFIRAKFDYHPACEVYTNHVNFLEGIDLMICLGGDGSFLRAVRYIRSSGVPILGINTGRLGFLTNISKEAIADTFHLLESREYEYQKRSLLQVKTQGEIFDDENFALNELTITKKDSSSMIIVHAQLDNKYLNSYWADGLIVATPTGSTGYNLSCGGPIITPGCKVHIITPIAAHNLNVRPVVVPDHLPIDLSLESRDRTCLVSLDGVTKNIKQGEVIRVTKADFLLNVIKFEHTNFLDTIRNKMYWGIDKRN
ncbi:MAG: NAD kinase [Bacteroidetes bacterium]|nr:NAD kinase [Bacteroidota bacterium]MBM3425171.1 NAD kinase [Bacteroidota bacterium]